MHSSNLKEFPSIKKPDQLWSASSLQFERWTPSQAPNSTNNPLLIYINENMDQIIQQIKQNIQLNYSNNDIHNTIRNHVYNNMNHIIINL